MLEYDPTTNLRHWPAPMARFGTNPYGDPLYRIIFAPSRRNLAGDESGFRWIPTYRRLGDVWVLERWHSPEQFCRMSRERWDREMLILGPYPDRGEYAHVHTFFPVLPDHCNLDKLITWIEAGQKTSYQDNHDAIREHYDHETKARQSTVEAMTRDLYPAFGATAMSSAKVSRGTKHLPNLKSANELGLPTGNNKFLQLRGKPNGLRPHLDR